MNDWHTCKASGDIRASNPCSEYMFLDDTACNLASANLITFYNTTTKRFDVESYEHLCRLWTVVLEISVMMAQFPSKAIAELSYEFRTLGLGFANIGGLLMTMGLPYDSKEGRALCGALTAIMTGVAYATSAEMAGELGPFPGYKKNAAHMLRVIRNHRRAAHGESRGLRGARRQSGAARPRLLPAGRHRRRTPIAAWDDALALGEVHGYRNAQTTVVAPTGTIGLVMDCDTTGIEPDFALVKFKKLAGGGYWKIINRAVPEALRTLGYRESDIAEIEAYAVGHGSLSNAPGINVSTLKAKGFTDEAHGEGREGAADRLRHQVRLQQVDLWRGLPARHAEHRARGDRRPRLRPARGARLHQARDRGRQRAHLRRDDGGRRAASEGRALSGVRLRQPLRQDRQALSLGREPHPHDGGLAAVHLGRDLARPSTCRTTPRWRIASPRICCPGSSR